MGDFASGLIVLLVVVFIWALIGHGLWLLFKRLLTELGGDKCRCCGKKYLTETCPHCVGKRESSAESPTIETDFRAARRFFQYSRFRNWLDDSKSAELERLLQELHRRLEEESAAREDSLSPATSPAAVAWKQREEQPHAPPRSIDEDRGTQPLSTPVRKLAAEAVEGDRLALPLSASQRADESALDEPLVGAGAATRPSQPMPQPQPHPLDREEPVPVPKPPLRKQITAELLKSFMEKSNIRWIEIISAALIVVCSVGLVISLWSTLSSTSRFFPSLVFLLATLAVHGAGQYTLRQWKLRTTSRGILQIGLMLIPLAVLVGILLSRRENELPSLDWATSLVILLGSVIYGALAVTASKILFQLRWPLVAITTIISSLTLLPVHFFEARDRLGAPFAAWILLPLLLVNIYASLMMSQSSLRAGVSSVRMMRIATIVTQVLFASLVAWAFWVIRARGSGGLSDSWWVMAGIFSAAWTSWGWSASATQFGLGRGDPDWKRQPVWNASSSWLVIMAWSVASLGTVFLVACLWQVAFSRSWLSVMLFAIGGIGLLQGWRCNLRISLLAGGIAALGAVSLWGEWPFADKGDLQPSGWLSLSRITALFVTGGIASLAAGWCRMYGSKAPRPQRGTLLHRHVSASLSSILEQLQHAGFILVAVSALLTFITSLVPWGVPPYGGNWAGLMMLGYGLLAIATGCIANRQHLPGLLSQAVVPTGQIIMLIAMVRMCQTSPMLEDALGSLRPERSWAVGLMILAAGWSTLAAVLRGSGRFLNDRLESGFEHAEDQARQHWNLNALNLGAACLAPISGIAIWTHPDGFHWACWLGWLCPLTVCSIFVSWRNSHWRELFLLVLCGWAGTVLYHLGFLHAWWSELGIAASMAVFAVWMVSVLAIAASCFAWIGRLSMHSPKAESTTSGGWIHSGPPWASQSVLAGCWLSVIVSLSCTAVANIQSSIWGSFSRGFLDRDTWELLTPQGFVCSILSIIALTSYGVWLARTRSLWILLNYLVCVPVASGLALASFIDSVFVLPITLGYLALWLIISECLPFFGGSLNALSRGSWQRLIEFETFQKKPAEAEELPSPQATSLMIARMLCLLLLIAGSLLLAERALVGQLPDGLAAPTASWSGNVLHLLILLGPLFAVASTRWTMSVWQGEKPSMISVSGISAGVISGMISALALNTRAPADLLIMLVQSTLFASALLAWLTVGYATARNFVGLRRMVGSSKEDQPSTWTLLTKSMKGGRWKQAEQASWWMVIFAGLATGVLCLASACFVVLYPVEIPPGLSRLGNVFTSVSSVAALGLLGLLAQRRGANRFGLLAAGLGLLAPLGAVSYASWLAADATRSFAQAADFEPYRMLVGLWLLSLCIGLLYRMLVLQDGKSQSSAAEVAWILLATTVGLLSLVSIVRDPNPIWPLWQLSALALLAVLSGVASGQAWRGHVAAVLAAAALGGWLFDMRSMPWFPLGWLTLWGPIWVAFTALAAKLRRQTHSVSATPAHRTQWTVEQSVSICLPITAAAGSFVLLVSRRPVLTTDFYGYLIALSVTSLLLAIVRLWDRQPGQRGLAVYINLLSLSLVSSVSLCALARLPWLESCLLWIASGLGAMALMAAATRELVRESSHLGRTLHLGSVTNNPWKFEHALTWMPVVHTLLSMLALIPSILLVMGMEERTMRVAATSLPFIGALSILPIARGRRIGLRYSGLSLISASLILLWWADLPQAFKVSGFAESWIFEQRLFAAFAVLGAIYPLIAVGIRDRETWQAPLMHFGWMMTWLAAFTGGCLLFFQFEGVWRSEAFSASIATKMLTLFAWLAIIARWLQFAIKPHATDQSASELTRRMAVYVAELGLSLFAAACYFHFPKLFGGVFVNWWPLIVLAIAMLSAGLGHWLHCAKRPILADPVLQSSLLLPLIPLAGVWWIQPASADWHWSEWDRYAFLLLTAAGLYGLQGWFRQSVRLRGLAAGFLLASFWVFLHSQPNLRFFDHPQFWLLPPALCILAFVEWNQNRLDRQVLIAGRYLCVLAAYLSSTAEIFLKAFEGQLWQPLLLLVLALAGVAAGIILRVRAFLYCGSAFTLVALLGMVWHAQQAIGQVWPWWVFGIATGIGLIVLLGFFEKNRPRVLAYLDELRKWEA